jgi:wyosine [tRNA(Phe)-imidazoG37] synthetase (radical SAM superfamily)
MPTILFNEIIFGPVQSRRLGVSLGINLLPLDGKICSFDCVYCECGLNAQHKGGRLPKSTEVIEALELKLRRLQEEGVTPDVITFAGNGEPTLHPEFGLIIDQTIELRNRFFPKARVSVLSNATQLDNPNVFQALLKVDQAVLKLDSAFDETVCRLDRPVSKTYSIRKVVDQMKAFHGKLIIQTLFTRGEYEWQPFDNTTQEEVSAWIKLLAEIRPESVMIYTIDRETPIKSIIKVPLKELREIAKQVKAETGLPVSVAG